MFHHSTLVHCGRALSIGCAAVSLAALLPAVCCTAEFEFDPDAKSPWVIRFDPDGLFLAHNAYVGSQRPFPSPGPGPFDGTNINTLLGADTFYTQGYTGTNAVVAVIDAGHIWNGHETLSHAQQIPNHWEALNEIDQHATLVSMTLGGRRGGAHPGPYQEGLAPDAQLYGGALAAEWHGTRPANFFYTFDGTVFDQYRRAFSLGVHVAGRCADVINASWGGPDPSGVGTLAIGLDGLANANPQTLHVAAAGNEGPRPNTVISPAAGYNVLTVGALGPDPTYDTPTSFTSSGPNSYADPWNGWVGNARQVVHIAAPGDQLTSALYGGETGSNGMTDNPRVTGTGPTGSTPIPPGGPDWYVSGMGGTSFASPTVAGGAVLLYDASYSVFAGNDNARDARVMKSVLMNSAWKTVDWDNGQIAHPNGLGGVLTTQGLDNRVGTGRMDLHAAFDQFLSGTTDLPDTLSGDLGLVQDLGWDFGRVNSQATNDYYFDAPLLGGSTLTATVDWFRDRRYVAENSVWDDSYDDLNLELWSVLDGMPDELISESSSRYNNSEHFSFELPGSGDYALRVRWFGELFDRYHDPDEEFYGLAWSAIYQDAGDFDDDGDYDCQDIDGLVAEIVAGTDARLFDLTGDHLVNLADRDAWLAIAGAANLPSGNPYVLGDANLDGVVDVSDFNRWNANKFTFTAAWCAGDFNSDGVVDVPDFNVWNSNKFTLSRVPSAVPEPACWLLVVAACLRVLGERRRPTR